jgi:hypothetical protein
MDEFQLTHSTRRGFNVEQKPKNDYPTDQQIEDSYKAYKEGGEKGILEFPKEQRRKREAETQEKK